MKAAHARSKRNPVKKAYQSGYAAGLRGMGEEQCPFEQLEKRGAWFGGWRLGRADFLSGYIGEHDHPSMH